MPSAKNKKPKNKLLKIDMSSDSESGESEHELFYYAKDKVKLMKEVLKIIKPKKIKAMAPDCIKNLDIVEINSMLLEELLGISNKRLQYIFNGENVDRETSSSESDEEKQPVDVISLDDISDDDDIELCISQDEKQMLETESSKRDKKPKSHKLKFEAASADVKLEKGRKSKRMRKDKDVKDISKESDKDKLMSVLELLELQARARAIRSQLAIESESKKDGANVKLEDDSDSDDVIIESPQNKEIVINSSDSEGECSRGKRQGRNEQSSLCLIDDGAGSSQVREQVDAVSSNTQTDAAKEDAETTRKRKEKLMAKIQKIKLVRNKPPVEKSGGCDGPPVIGDPSAIIPNKEVGRKNEETNGNAKQETEDVKSSINFANASISSCDNDEIVINLDEDELDGID